VSWRRLSRQDRLPCRTARKRLGRAAGQPVRRRLVAAALAVRPDPAGRPPALSCALVGARLRRGSGWENPCNPSPLVARVYRGKAASPSNPHSERLRGWVQQESILSAPPASDGTKAGPPRRSTQDRFLNVRPQRAFRRRRH
jgi:hypothetical protein